jgi:hypothetical protein
VGNVGKDGKPKKKQMNKTAEIYRAYFVKRGQPTKYQFYMRSKKVALFYVRQML